MDDVVRLMSSYLLTGFEQVLVESNNAGLSPSIRADLPVATATSHCLALSMGLAQGHTVVMNDLYAFLRLNYPKNAP